MGEEFSLRDSDLSDEAIQYFYGVDKSTLLRLASPTQSKSSFTESQLSYARLLFELGTKADLKHGPLYHAYGNMEMVS
jgi:hypothetical protein